MYFLKDKQNNHYFKNFEIQRESFYINDRFDIYDGKDSSKTLRCFLSNRLFVTV